MVVESCGINFSHSEIRLWFSKNNNKKKKKEEEEERKKRIWNIIRMEKMIEIIHREYISVHYRISLKSNIWLVRG